MESSGPFYDPPSGWEQRMGYQADTHDDEHFWRLLGSKDKDPVRVDYSVLSVGVMTLGLILVVEVLRHRIDHSAEGRPFFKAVLEGVYSELATLGIVEFFLYVLSTYYENLDKNKYYVFADVHFALFYTAIFNAFQSVIVAFAATRVSRRKWVQTEMLELNHYVEIREEFESVKRELEQARKSSKSGSESTDTSASGGANNNDADTPSSDEEALDNEQGFFESIVYPVRYPALLRRYNELLIQVRFHELRVHFLTAYSLPSKFKVSDYLMRREQKVLLKLVHVSAVAWLLLTGAVNILYFVLGIVSYKVADPSIVGTSLIWIFFLTMAVFVLVASLVYSKMTSIYKAIMVEKHLWDVHNVESEERERLAEKQLGLFWGGDPKLVMAAIQFMQFGYAVALSILIIYWTEIDDGTVDMYVYMSVLAVCYIGFVLVTAHAIPRYTLCTSLAQLVCEKTLDETLADLMLEDAKRKQLQQNYIKNVDEGFIAPNVGKRGTHTVETDAYSTEVTATFGSASPSSAMGITSQLPGQAANGGLTAAADQGAESVGSTSALSIPSLSQRESKWKERKRRQKTNKTVSDGVAMMARMHQAEVTDDNLMAELVKGDTDSLRAMLPDHERAALSLRDAERARKRGTRRKANSGGVSSMAGSEGSNSGAKGPPASPRATDDSHLERDSLGQLRDFRAGRPPRPRPNRKKAVSDMGVYRSGLGTIDSKPLTVEVAKQTPPSVFGSFFGGASGGNQDGSAAGDDSVSHSSSAAIETVPSKVILEDMPSALRLATDTVRFHPDSSEDGHSDADDVPVVSPSVANHTSVHSKKRIPIHARLKAYFMSRRYVVVSNIIGTLPAFFLVGQRIERFLHTEGITPPKFVSFDMDNQITFWSLVFLFAMFLCGDTLIFYTFKPWNGIKSLIHKKVVIAAILDSALVATCLAVFLVAETKRCCQSCDDKSRELYAEYAEDAYPADGYGKDPYLVTEPVTCGCPTFGQRLCGGLGVIEPYISLIGLRVFRHWLAKRLAMEPEKEVNWHLSARGLNLQPLDVFGDQHGHNDDAHGEQGNDGHGHGDHGHGHGEATGTAAELWKAAMVQHKDVASKYGEFSSEMLKAMLGIQVQTHDPHQHAELHGKESDDEPEPRHFTLGRQYSDLAPKAQGVIMAGMLGRSVNPTALGERLQEDKIPEDDELWFQVDANASQTGNDTTVFEFTCPGAPLVRSMRRCDRMLVPILKKWTVVDVVLTRFEIVYFDASDVDGPVQDLNAEATKQALSATKGGKGLRLCDVAAGRRVVGHLALSEIESVTVERQIPVEGENSTTAEDGPEVEVDMTEYWMHQHHPSQDEDDGKEIIHPTTRASTWKTIKEDRLKINTVHGHTLHLRYYSDLQDAILHPDRLESEDELKGPIVKNNALHWAQTIGRICGPDQLKQSLAHFADNSFDELRDYLVVHCAETGRRKGWKKGLYMYSDEVSV